MKRPKKSLVNDKGAAGEYFFAAEALLKGYMVSWPSSQRVAYDVLVDTGNNIYRVQVKAAFKKSSSRRTYNFSLTHGTKKNLYAANAFDILALYVAPERKWYIIPTLAKLPGHVTIGSKGSKWDEYLNAWEHLK